MYDLPSYVWALVLAGAIGIPASTSAVLYRGALAAGVGRRTATAVTATTATVLGGWLVVSALLAGAAVCTARIPMRLCPGSSWRSPAP
jgi:phosphate/sulfate permease